jgi:hypothetical protein
MQFNGANLLWFADLIVSVILDIILVVNKGVFSYGLTLESADSR